MKWHAIGTVPAMPYLRNSDAIYAVSVFGSSVPTVPTRPIVANQLNYFGLV